MSDYITACFECGKPLGQSCVYIPADPSSILSHEAYCCSPCVERDQKRFPDHYRKLKTIKKFLNHKTGGWEELRAV